jgi:glutathione S-transferase
MLKIYGVTRSRASRVVWLCEELGLPYEQVPVIQRYRIDEETAARVLHTKSPAFLAINPNGHIPSIDDDGLVLHESLAITLYLAVKHGGPLGPADLAEQGLMTSWSFWAAIEVETAALDILQGRSVDANVEKLRAPFAVLDAALGAGGGHVVGGRFTVADLNLAEVLRYAKPATALFDGAPRVKAWLEACQSRPAFKAMWAKRLAEPE